MATNKITGKSYIGQAVSFLSSGVKWGTRRRWQKHCSNARTKKFECMLLENSIAKHRELAWDVQILEYCSMEQLNALEDMYIIKHNTMAPRGYNLMSGGGNGRKHSESTRRKMTKTRTGKKFTDETRKSQSNSMRARSGSLETLQNVLKELDVLELHRGVYFCEYKSKAKVVKSFTVVLKNGKKLTTTSGKKSVAEKYKECLKFIEENEGE